MAPQLLPASAAAFAPRATHVNVVLGSEVDLWLTQTLKRIVRSKRSLNSTAKHQRCLTEILSSKTAVWTLTSVMVPRFSEIELNKDQNPLIEALLNYIIIHIEAYIVHVDMVLENEVAFKLTPQSIEALINYHKEVFSVNLFSSISPWPGMDTQIEELRKDFIRSVNKFVFRTHVSVLEGLYEDGSGELLSGKSEVVKMNILSLFRSPPCIKENLYPEIISPNCGLSSGYGPQSSTYSAISGTQKTETQILSSPKTFSFCDLIPPYTHMGLNNIEETSLMSSFNKVNYVDEMLSSPSQPDFLVPDFLYTHFEIQEQLYVCDLGCNNENWGPNYKWI
ncbi:hypothetical protein OnM2_003008 [Erysiphe neolycopersici]|uniref:Uncharacterized protein n=1 Tax=Erysiphe neolycopersici TaxID=212602 RepID=A0A420I7P0_9PEZI|nr:hypothetical protein OnM2_003008 [Erysiphe neolycopersici]